MLDDTTLENGNEGAIFGSFKASRNSSDLMASSPRTAYWTLKTAGLRSSTATMVEILRRWLLVGKAFNR